MRHDRKHKQAPGSGVWMGNPIASGGHQKENPCLQPIAELAAGPRRQRSIHMAAAAALHSFSILSRGGGGTGKCNKVDGRLSELVRGIPRARKL